MNEFYSQSQMEIAQPLVEARKRFRTRMEKWKNSEAKMRWILRSEVSTPEEKQTARDWLRKFGWSEEQIQAVKVAS
jgi:hypothetical protein